MKTYFGLANPPVKLAKVAIGDGTIGSSVVWMLLPTVRLSPETYFSQIIQLSCPSSSTSLKHTHN
jgi:hypothetical protein